MIINPRGTNGAGKTELVRRILTEFGQGGTTSSPMIVAGRLLPIGYRLAPADGGRPLTVFGHYERTSGGTDTVTLKDGGLDEVFRLAEKAARDGSSVLIEGSSLSEDHARTAALAARHPLHVVWVDTAPEQCVRNLIARRRAGRHAWGSIATVVQTRREAVERACLALQGSEAVMHVLPFAPALALVRSLLGLGLSRTG